MRDEGIANVALMRRHAKENIATHIYTPLKKKLTIASFASLSRLWIQSGYGNGRLCGCASVLLQEEKRVSKGKTPEAMGNRQQG